MFLEICKISNTMNCAGVSLWSGKKNRYTNEYTIDFLIIIKINK